MSGTIDTLIIMVFMNAPLHFPESSLFGRLFNDYLNGLPIMEIYKPYAVDIVSRENSTLFYLGQEGRVLICHRHNAITGISCAIVSIDTRYELYTYIKENMTLVETSNNTTRIYTYQSDIIFSASVCLEKEYIEDTFFLFYPDNKCPLAFSNRGYEL